MLKRGDGFKFPAMLCSVKSVDIIRLICLKSSLNAMLSLHFLYSHFTVACRADKKKVCKIIQMLFWYGNVKFPFIKYMHTIGSSPQSGINLCEWKREREKVSEREILKHSDRYQSKQNKIRSEINIRIRWFFKILLKLRATIYANSIWCNRTNIWFKTTTTTKT